MPGREGVRDIQHRSAVVSDSPALPRVAGWLAVLLALAFLVLVPTAAFWVIRGGALEDLRAEGLAAAQSRALRLTPTAAIEHMLPMIRR